MHQYDEAGRRTRMTYPDGNLFNGLNQLIETAGLQVGHNARGDVTKIGSASYGYTSESQMTSAPSVTMTHDLLMRLYQVVGPSETSVPTAAGSMPTSGAASSR